MSKPFKSQFDLMAEAYGNVNYNKQKLINEDTAGKTVIGYPPSEDYEDAEHEDGEHSPVQKCVAAIDALAAGGSDVESCTAAIDQLAATLEGDEKVAAYEDLRDYMKGSLSHADSYEDLNDYLNARLGQSEVEDAEEAGFNRKQLDELEDIVHAILDKRDHEDRAAKHEDGEY
jgi:hypothetical protein